MIRKFLQGTSILEIAYLFDTTEAIVNKVRKEERWDYIKAQATIDKLILADVDPELPYKVKVVVFKLKVIANEVKLRMATSNDIWLHTFAEKIDNYNIKVKLADFSNWANDVWGVAVVEKVGDLVDIDWVVMIETTEDMKAVEQHAKVLVDKLELQKTVREYKPFKDPQGHAERCEKLNIGVYDFDEAHVLKKYKLIWGGLE